MDGWLTEGISLSLSSLSPLSPSLAQGVECPGVPGCQVCFCLLTHFVRHPRFSDPYRHNQSVFAGIAHSRSTLAWPRLMTDDDDDQLGPDDRSWDGGCSLVVVLVVLHTYP